MKINIGLTNRRAYFGHGFPYQDILSETRFHPVGYQHMPRFYQGWDGYNRLLKKDKELGSYYCGAGLFLALRPMLEKKYNLKFEVNDHRVPPKFGLGGPVSDRDYQRECLDAMIEGSHTGGLILAATGTGKTRMAGDYFSRLRGNACFVVDELQLLLQAQEELSKTLGEPVGNIGDQLFEPKRVTVATIQTLDLHSQDPKFIPWAKSVEVLLIDEIHLMLSKRSFSVVEQMEPKAVFGLTATLELQKKHVRLPAYNLCGPVIFTYPLTEAVAEGHLVDGLVVAAEFSNELHRAAEEGPRMPYWRRNYGSHLQMLGQASHDYHTQYRQMISENKKRNNRVEALARAAVDAGRSVIVMVQRVDHLKQMSYRFHDIPHELMYGGRKAVKRVADSKRFDKGEFPLIIANQVFKKGVNIRAVNTIIDTVGGTSHNDAKQKYGRGVRTLEGKDGLIYIDMCDIQESKKDAYGKEIKNRFAKAAKQRIKAYKKLGVDVFRVPPTVTAEVILARAIAALAAKKKSAQLELVEQ